MNIVQYVFVAILLIVWFVCLKNCLSLMEETRKSCDVLEERMSFYKDVIWLALFDSASVCLAFIAVYRWSSVEMIIITLGVFAVVQALLFLQKFSVSTALSQVAINKALEKRLSPVEE